MQNVGQTKQQCAMNLLNHKLLLKEKNHRKLCGIIDKNF